MQFEQFGKSKGITTKQQYALMIELLQQKPEMAQGFTKLRRLKEQSATGGGRNRQHHFNELEEAVIALTALETSTSGIANTVSIGLPIVADVSNETEADVSMPSVTCSPALPRRTTRPPEKSTADLLKEQLDIQKEFQEKVLDNLDDLSLRMRRVGRALEMQNGLKKAEVEEFKRHNIAMENLVAAKNSIKQQMLEDIILV
ncbi:PREDICTED: uncharacterized protein LOC108976368 [Bactrocera latifrons]|uniref:uncharacterized protein LOC108976368 n=1 Tax=Bactrocera latifrons TaxID=174628 RepID=UPI0008DD566E|nr:PREDICTED: uncharacterized protein LOC108976368 [Bactrocera latifrons]